MAALEHMTLDDVRDFHRRAYQPAHAVLIVVGDLSHDRAREEAAGAFGTWTTALDAGHIVAPASTRLGMLPIGCCWSIAPRPRNPSCASGHVAVSRRTPDYHALVVGQSRARRTVREPAEHEPART
jgi:hypothetical protein